MIARAKGPVRAQASYGNITVLSLLKLACEQAHLFWTGSLDRELARRMGPTLFLASPVLGTSEPARRLYLSMRMIVVVT